MYHYNGIDEIERNYEKFYFIHLRKIPKKNKKTISTLETSEKCSTMGKNEKKISSVGMVDYCKVLDKLIVAKSKKF